MSDPWFRIQNGWSVTYQGNEYHGEVQGRDHFRLISIDSNDLSRGFICPQRGYYTKVVHRSELTQVRKKQWWAKYRGHAVMLSVSHSGIATIWLNTPAPPELGLVESTRGGFDKNIPFEELEDYWVELTPSSP